LKFSPEHEILDGARQTVAGDVFATARPAGVSRYVAAHRNKRVESERFRRFDYDAITKRDKINLDVFWLKNDSIDDPDLLSPPDEIADLRRGVDQSQRYG
jgi:hypothetical protein